MKQLVLLDESFSLVWLTIFELKNVLVELKERFMLFWLLKLNSC